MESVTVERSIDAPLEHLRDRMRDLESFTRAGGFDTVEVEGDSIEIANAVGLLRIELTLRVVESTDSVLALEQASGIFDEMRTTYELEPAATGTTVRARTEFAVSAPVVGPLFDATVVKRVRRSELERQLSWLASEA